MKKYYLIDAGGLGEGFHEAVEPIKVMVEK